MYFLSGTVSCLYITKKEPQGKLICNKYIFMKDLILQNWLLDLGLAK